LLVVLMLLEIITITKAMTKEDKEDIILERTIAKNTNINGNNEPAVITAKSKLQQS